MSTWLFLLGSACFILAPDNPVGLLILFMVACLKVWRTHDVSREDSDLGGGDSDSQTDSEGISRDCELI